MKISVGAASLQSFTAETQRRRGPQRRELLLIMLFAPLRLCVSAVNAPRRSRPIAIVIMVFLSASLLAQEVEVVKDTVSGSTNDSTIISKRGKVINIKEYAKRFNPRKALMYSAVFPGAGQIYNKKYWKLPIVYGGFFLIGTVAVAYNNLYYKYRTELIGVVNDKNFPTTNQYTEAQLRTLVDTYRRQRDYFIVIGGFLYVLQLIDAHVDAHLKEFDLNPQLKVSLEPSVQQNPLIGRISGVSLVLKF